MDAPYRIRSAVPADAAAFFAIERRSFSDPWSEASFHEALSSPWTFGIAAQGSRGVAGYLIAREVAGTGEVLNLAVAPEFRRRGVGGALLRAGLTALRHRRVERGVPRGARIESLGPVALRQPRVPAGGAAGCVLPQSEGGRPGPSARAANVPREAATIGVTLVDGTT